MNAYKAFLNGLPQSCTDIALDRDRMMMCFETYSALGITAWEASAIHAAASRTEAVMPIERTLTLVRNAFRTIWGYAERGGADEPNQAQDLFKACKAIVGALKATEPHNESERAWVEQHKPHISPTLATAPAGAASLRHYPARQKMLKPYPKELPLAAYDNAPRRPPDDGAKKHLGQHARDQLRQLATLGLIMGNAPWIDPSLDPETVIQATCANTAALATPITESRKQAVGARFKAAKAEPALLTKGGLVAPQARDTVAKALPAPGKPRGQSRTRGRQPYQKPYGRAGKGKGRGKGKGKGHKRFTAPRPGAQEEDP